MRTRALAPTLGWRPVVGLVTLLVAFVAAFLLGPGAASGQSAPTVSGVAVTSDAGNDATYVLDDVIRVTLTFSEAVEVTGVPRLKIDMDPAEWGEKEAGYQSGGGTNSLIFTHTVVEPNISTQGIAVLADTLELNGGSIKSASSQEDADLSHDGLGHDTGHKVNWQASSPTVSGVAISSDAGGDDTYAKDDVIHITLTFSEAVEVTGSPQLAIDMDPAEWGEKQAGYESGSGTASLTFTHTVVEPNISTQGIAVLADSLELNNGTIQSASAQIDADLAHSGLPHDPNHKVDWKQAPAATPPTVTAVAVNSDAGDDDTYGLDDVIRITLTFSEAMDVTGTPQLKIDMDPAEWGEKLAAYASGGGTASLTFTHTVVEPNISTQGIAVLADSLELNGGSIQSAATQTDADLSHAGLAHDPNHQVDWRQEEPNLAPVLNIQAENYALFTGDNNAPRGILVSKPFHGVFSDPDGDELTYAVSVASGNAHLVELLQVMRHQDIPEERRVNREEGLFSRVWFTAESEADWKALDPIPPDRPVVTVTLTATDPGGLSASVDGDFLIWWDSYPEVESAVASKQAIALTFDMAVDAAPGPTPEQFTVKVVNSDGTTGTVAVSNVSVSGSVVTLELASELAAGQTVTLDYAHAADTPLQRAGGGDPAHGFTGQAVDMSQLGLPGPVANLGVIAQPGVLDLLARWDDVAGATSYKLRWRQSGGEFQAANAITVTGGAMGVVTVSGYGEWEVRAQGCNDDGCGPEASATVDVVPAASLSLARAVDAQGQAQPRTITATWDAVEDAASYTLRWQRLGAAAPASAQPDAAVRQTRSLDGASSASGQTSNDQSETNQLSVPAGRTSAELSVPDGKAYRVELEARGVDRDLVAMAHQHVGQADGGPDTTPPWLERGEIDGNKMILYFSEPLDEGPVGGYWDGGFIEAYVQVGGGVRSYEKAHGRGMEISGNKVTVRFESLRARVGLDAGGRYIRRAAATTKVLRDLAGNPMSVPYQHYIGWWGTGWQRLNNITGRPHVTGVVVSSNAGADRLYADGDTIRVQITFSEAVNVTGRPRLKIDLDRAGGGERWASYASGSGTTTLAFAYTVDDPDRSTQGVAVLRDALDLSGGVIRSAGTQRDANLWYAGLDHDSNHTVDWQRLAPGVHRVTGVAISSNAGADQSYVDGDTIQVTLTFGERVIVTGAPRLKIDLDRADGGEKWADYASGSGTTMLVFTYTVVDADLSTAGVAVLRHSLELNGGTIRSTAATPVNAHLRHAGLDHDLDHQVNSKIPMLQSATVDGTRLALAYDTALDENSAPAGTAFTVNVNGSEVSLANTDPVKVRSVAVILTLAAVAAASDTVTVSYAKPTATGASKVRDAAGNEAASFTDQAAGPDTIPPRLVGGEIDGDTMAIHFSEALDPDSVGGYFRVNLQWADNSGNPRPYDKCRSDTSGWRHFTAIPKEVFVNDYTVVVVGLSDGLGRGLGYEMVRAGVGQPYNNFTYHRYNDPAGKVLRDLAGNSVSDARVLTMDNTTRMPWPERATVVGKQLILTFNAPMDGNSVPGPSAFTVKVDGSQVNLANANPVAVSGNTVTLTLAAAVAAGDAVTVSYAYLSGSPLQNVICEDAEVFADQAVMNFTGVSAVSGVAISSDPGDDETYGSGETIRVRLTFSEAVTVTGKPRLKIGLNSGSREKLMWYESGSGTSNLVFARKVLEPHPRVEPEVSTAGIAVLANSLELNGGAIQYVYSGKPAYLAHIGLDHDANHQVNWHR